MGEVRHSTAGASALNQRAGAALAAIALTGANRVAMN